MNSSREDLILGELRLGGALRELGDYFCCAGMLHSGERDYVNLSSNDYLGISGRMDWQAEFFSGLVSEEEGVFLMSNPSSRLMCGNSGDYGRLESVISLFLGTEAALVSGSGFLLNSSILRAVTDKDSVVVADKLVHASLNDGLLLVGCKFERFNHNDLGHLEKILKRYEGRHVVVVVESVYSMDGDLADVSGLLGLKSRYGFELIVDEAHALGVFGVHGEGLFPRGADVDYRIATMGKSCASTGAFVGCTEKRKQVLVNKMRSTIFSTALPPINLRWSEFVLRKLPTMTAEREHLWRLIKIMNGTSQIIPVMAGSNHGALEISNRLKDNGYWATAIRHPTVRKGTERVRMSLTAAHTTEQIEELCKLIG